MPFLASIRRALHQAIVEEGSPRPGAWVIAGGWLALNLLLFVPFYLVVSLENDFWPFFPLGHPRGPYVWEGPGAFRSVYEYAMQLFVRRHNLDIFRVSADWVFIVSSLVLASRFASRWRTGAISLAWGGYIGLFGFLVYSAFIQDLRAQPAVIADDILLLESAWIFVRDTWTTAYTLYAGVGVAAAGIAAARLGRYLHRVWRWGGGEHGARRLVLAWAVVNLYCLSSTAWFGIERDDAVVQVQAKHVHANWQRSRAVAATVQVLNGPLVSGQAERLVTAPPLRRPDIYLFEVESYGSAMWIDEAYASARRGLARRVESQLRALQLPILTRFATAPVHGGGSWMSTASVLSGLKIDTQTLYAAWKRLAGRFPHLVSYLNQHDYYTLAVQSGTTWTEDIYGYDEMIIREDFAYDGPFHGFGGVPDQWALDYAFSNQWKEHRAPRLFHFFAVSTHFAWLPPPRITEDVALLRTPQTPFIQTQPEYAELAGTIPEGLKRDYFVTLAYEWELLLDAFRERVDPGFVALIFGDHQAPFITDGYGDNDVVLHIVTDMPGYPEALAATGFANGVVPAVEPDGATSLRMEGFYSFVLSLLTTPEGESLDFAPTGVDLRTLVDGS